ncbi:MAG: cytidine monophosphate (UMP-CMP) kinase 1, cytosolic [Marteilia pararefringens]
MVGLCEAKQLFRIVFLLGPPGSGKGEIGKFLSNRFRVPTFSCGDLLREQIAKANNSGGESSGSSKLASQIREIINAGNIVPARITVELMLDKLQQIHEQSGKNLVIIDGFPRNMDNYDTFETMAKNKAEIHRVLYLKCPKEVCFDRCYKRGVAAESSGEIKREDDSEEIIRERIRKDWENTGPVHRLLMQLGLITEINSNQELEAMCDEAEGVFSQLLISGKENSPDLCAQSS